MTVLRMDHVGVVVDDLDTATAFFGAIGLEVVGTGTVGDERVDRLIALTGVQARIAMLATPDGHTRLELTQFETPAAVGDADLPSNTRGLRHVCFAVTGIDAKLADLEARGYGLVGERLDYGDSYRLAYVRGPGGIIVELAEQLSGIVGAGECSSDTVSLRARRGSDR